MNKTGIEYVDYTWNPVTGCRHGCHYCFARAIAHRFMPPGRGGSETGTLHEASPLDPPYKWGFDPTFWPRRLQEPFGVKKPARIFAVDMGDLFGAWVPTLWLEAVRLAATRADWHTFLFLTKAATALKKLRPVPPNFWLGVSVTQQIEVGRVDELLEVVAPVRFVSLEPLLSPVSWVGRPDWIVIGALTRNGKTRRPELGGTRREWVLRALDQANDQGIPVFLKDNLRPLLISGGAKLTQEFPHV